MAKQLKLSYEQAELNLFLINKQFVLYILFDIDVNISIVCFWSF